VGRELKMPTGWKLFFEAVWPMCGRKIKVVTSHINRLTVRLRNKVSVEHIEEEHKARLGALEHFDRSEKHHQREEFQSLKADFSPKTYDDMYYRLQRRFCEGTGNWLIKDATFTKWLDISESSKKVLWLQGIPGAGALSPL
jgi:hypothetical protein